MKWAAVFCFIFAVGALKAQTEERARWEAEADTLYSHENFAKAAQLYSKILEKTDEGEQVFKCLYKRAICYFQDKKLEQAVADLDRFLEKLPHHRQAHIVRALVYRDMEKLPEQLQDIEQALLQEMDPALLKWKASILLEMRRNEEAKQDLLEALKISPDMESYQQLAIAYFREDDLEEALVQLAEAIKLNPNEVQNYIYGSSFCMSKDEFAKSIPYSDVALALAPDNPVMLFYKGVALVELDKKTEGCRCIKEAFDQGHEDAAGYLKEYCYNMEE